MPHVVRPASLSRGARSMTDWTPRHGRPRLPIVRAQSGSSAGGSSTSPPPAPPPPSTPPTPAVTPSASGPYQPPTGSDRTPWWRLLLLIVVPLVAFLLLIAAFVFALSGRSGPVDLTADLAPGTSLSVELPNAAVTLEPSDDDQVHVHMTGSFFGAEPTLTARTENGVTEVRGGCRSQLFSRCSVAVTVQLPPALPTSVEGQNGRVTASGLTGRLDVHTTTGAIETTGTVGRLDLRTTNGDIRVTDAASAAVAATTTNGSVALHFLTPPDSVDAGSTNGSVTVRVPVDGVTYRVTAQTTNGTVNDGGVPTDSTTRRSITVHTTNGAITVEPAR